MKPAAGLLAALASCVAAAGPAAEVYLIPGRGGMATAPATTTVSPKLGQLLLTQRLAPFGQGPSVDDFPRDMDIEGILSFVNRFGKEPPQLFADSRAEQPSQLVLVLEGLSSKQMQELRKAWDTTPAFLVEERSPAAGALGDLARMDPSIEGILRRSRCHAGQILNPLEECWNGEVAAFARYNGGKDPASFQTILHRYSQLKDLARLGEIEAAIVLLPATENAGSWSKENQELRRRQAEQVMAPPERIEDSAGPDAGAAGKEADSLASAAPIPSCFKSEESCVSATGNCSMHGNCLNKYAGSDGSDDDNSCWTCHCLSTRSKSGSLTHWAGPICAKKDVSVPFWLLSGVSLALVGILSLSVSMLFNVGEQKLPGVIGAGVSRTK